MTFKNIRIVTDSTCDLPPELVQKWNITVVPAYVNHSGKSFADDGVELNRDDYYKQMESLRPYPSTAAPAPGLSELMLKKAFEGADHLVILSAPALLSGIHNSLRLGAMDLPQERVSLIDSEMLSWGLGYQVQIAAEVAAETGDVQKVIQAAERVRKAVRVYFTPEMMDALRRSGRISMASFGVATLLQVRPVIQVGDSKVETVAKVRTSSKAVEKLIELTRQNAPFDRVAIGHVNKPEMAEQVRKSLADVLPADTRIFTVTPVLGTNLGNNAVGVISLNQGWKA